MEFRATPFCGKLIAVAIENRKESLSTHRIKVNNETVCIFH